MARQHFRKRGHEYLLLYASLFIFIFILIPVTPILGYKPVRFIVTDLNGKPLEGAIVTLETIDTIFILPPTNGTGVTQSIDPIPQGTYRVTVKWKCPYINYSSLVYGGNIQIGEPYIFELKANVFSLDIKLVTLSGIPLSGIPIYLNGYFIGFTGQDGMLYLPQIPAGSYKMNATWLGMEIGPSSIEIKPEDIKVITARNVAKASILVIGSRGQKLDHALVEITKGNTTLSYATDERGTVTVELPIGNYTVMVNYGQFKANSTLKVPSTVNIFILDVFIELFGVGMSLAQFLLFIVMIEVIVIVLAIVVYKYEKYEYDTYRKRIFRRGIEREEKKEVKTAPVKPEKKHAEEIKAIPIRDILIWMLFPLLASLMISVIIVVGVCMIMPPEIAEKILGVFPYLAAALVTSSITIYVMARRKRIEGS